MFPGDPVALALTSLTYKHLTKLETFGKLKRSSLLSSVKDGVVTLSITTLSTITFSITTFSITTFRMIKIKCDIQQNYAQHIGRSLFC
jgi:hypothetical protein